jgi:nitrite reductase/ring-hydroxylating ferredoxin subunit
MPEAARLPQLLCASDDLAERGQAVCFELLEQGSRTPAFVLRYEGTVHAYLNRCAHVPAEMDWQPGHFLDLDKRFIVCSMHGALYDPPNGLCVSGPCRGSRLQALDVRESQGQVHWYPDERCQPLA